MKSEQFANYCLIWLDRAMSDAGFKRVIQEARPLLQYSELWQAARDAVKRGDHDEPCDNTRDETQPCSIHLATGRARRDRLIAVLDKAGYVYKVGQEGPRESGTASSTKPKRARSNKKRAPSATR